MAVGNWYKALSMQKNLLRPSLLVAAFYLVFVLYFIGVQDYTIIDFVHIGERWQNSELQGTWGYDGQFYYQIAMHPLDAAPRLDHASYRYQRILYPLVVWTLSFGDEQKVAFWLLFVNWLSISWGVELLAKLLEQQTLDPWYSLSYGLYFGLAGAFIFDTAEPFTYLLVIVAVVAWHKNKLDYAAAILGLATLSKETAALFTLGFLATFVLHQDWKSFFHFASIALLPYLLWLLTLQTLFGNSGLSFAPTFEAVPFAGIFHYADTPRKIWLLMFLLFIPTIGALGLAGSALSRGERHPLLFAWIVNICIIIFLSHASYMELISAGRISIGLPLATLLYGTVARNHNILRYSLYAALTIIIYIAGIVLGVDSFIM